MVARAQELDPRAYSVSPRGVNIAFITLGRSSGDLSFDPSLPIENANATLHASALGYVRVIDFFGRSANVGVALPYVWGTVQGDVQDQFVAAHRSGLGDGSARFSVNLHGAPSMNLEEFAKYRQGFNIGASLAVTAPVGQYNPQARLNIGTNRWGFKPEIGMSQRLGRWYLDFYLGLWLYTPNNNYLGLVRRQDPLGSSQIHVSYNLTRRMWAAFDANFYTGGRTSVGDVVSADLQRNSRIGATFTMPIGRHHSFKFSAARGAVTNIGANFTSLGMAYQFLWGGGL